MRRSYPRLLLLALVACVAGAIVVSAATSAGAFGAYNPAWDGTSDLRAMAADGGERIVVLDAERYDEIEPDGSVAVVLAPEESYSEADQERLRRFVADGGMLVVADRGERGNELLAAVGSEARFDGALLRDEQRYYRSPALPVADRVGEAPLVEGIDAVTLNHGTAVEPGNATVLASSSSFGYLDRDGNGELSDDEALGSYPVATGEYVGDGVVIAVSDPSLFINAMLGQTDNRAFANALFEGHDRIVLDYSHAERQPPLVTALLVFRETALAQALVGLLGVGAVAAWWRRESRFVASGRRRAGRLWRRLAVASGLSSGVRDAVRDPDALRAALVARHPEWDDDRIDRVMTDLLFGADEEESNE
ncbi:DUF4350 domain-containing protein [Haloferacaceae archaeon DSL9]